MSRYFNKDTPFFADATGGGLTFGRVYFGQPNTDPTDQDNNAKSPFADRELLVPADSVQELDIAGKLPVRVYLEGAYSITVTDADGSVIDADPYYVGESTDQIVNDSTAPGDTLSAAMNGLLARISNLEQSAVSLEDIWPVNGPPYISFTNEHPGSRLGFGTWVADCQGRVLIGVGSNIDANGNTRTFAAGSTGGAYTVALTEEQMPAHKHFMFAADAGGGGNLIFGDVPVARRFESGANGAYVMTQPLSPTISHGRTSSAGSGNAHENVQPWQAVYIWRRIA